MSTSGPVHELAASGGETQICWRRHCDGEAPNEEDMMKSGQQAQEATAML